VRVITAPLGPIGLIAIVYLGLIFANLSRRLCAVTKLKYWAGWFTLGSSLLGLAVASQIIRSSASLAPNLAPAMLLSPWFVVMTYYIPFALGVTIEFVLVWHYWRWTFEEKLR